MNFIRKYFGISYTKRDLILWVVNDSIHIYWRKGRFNKDNWAYWKYARVDQFGSIVADGYTSLDAQFTIKGKRISFLFTHFIDNATLRLYLNSLFI